MIEWNPSEDDGTLEVNMSCGANNSDDDPFHPLARALRNLLLDGKPQNRAAICLFDPEPSSALGTSVRWLGVFVHTAGRRVLFFPGFSKLETGYHFTSVTKGFEKQDKSFVFDHITLEKDLREIHVTMHEPKGHVSIGKAVDLGQGAHFWFGLSIPSIEKLRPVSRTNLVRFTVPETDAARRYGLFRHVQNTSMLDRILKLHPEAMSMNAAGFLHVKVFVGPRGFGRRDLINIPLGMPFNAKFTAPVYPHVLQISEEIDVQINTMWHPGRMGRSVIFSTGVETRRMS